MLSVTNIARVHGPLCKHFIVSVDHEGTARQIRATQDDIDALVTDLGGPIEAQKKLVLLWLAYRRFVNRPLTGVEIA